MLQVSDQFAGQVLKCEHCGSPYSVPVLPQSPVLASPVASPSAVAGSSSASAAAPGSGAAIEESENAYRLEPPAEARGPAAPESLGATPRPEAPYGVNAPESRAPMDGIPLPQPVAGYTHLYSIWVKPDVVKWLAPGALALTFILLFFSWIVPLGRPAEPLTGWQTGFGSHYNGFGLMFILLFLLSLAAAITSMILPRLSADRLHPRVRELLPWRSAVVFGLTALAFFFLALEIAMGFGADNEPSLGTAWFRLAVLATIVAVIGAALEWWLTLRGSALPPPRLDISW